MSVLQKRRASTRQKIKRKTEGNCSERSWPPRNAEAHTNPQRTTQGSLARTLRSALGQTHKKKRGKGKFWLERLFLSPIEQKAGEGNKGLTHVGPRCHFSFPSGFSGGSVNSSSARLRLKGLSEEASEKRLCRNLLVNRVPWKLADHRRAY